MRLGLLTALTLIAVGCLTGCKPGKVTTKTIQSASNESLATTPRGRQGIEMLTVLIPEQNGLDGLIKQNSAPIQSDEASRRLASEAILVRILKEEDLLRVLSTLEESGAAQNTWCGQMMEWRDLLEHRTKNQLMKLEEDLLLFNEGRLTIGARGWIEPSIEGVRTRVEVVPRHLPDRPQTPSLIRSNKVVPHYFDIASVQTELAPGEILMITCTAPLSDGWQVEPPEDVTQEATSDDPEPDNEKNATDIEPDATDPPAAERKKPIERLGHIMFMTPALSSERRSQRTALLLIPRIPSGMLPQENRTPLPAHPHSRTHRSGAWPASDLQRSRRRSRRVRHKYSW